MGRFTKVSEDAFDELQLDAGVLLSAFDPANQPSLRASRSSPLPLAAFPLIVRPLFRILAKMWIMFPTT